MKIRMGGMRQVYPQESGKRPDNSSKTDPIRAKKNKMRAARQGKDEVQTTGELTALQPTTQQQTFIEGFLSDAPANVTLRIYNACIFIVCNQTGVDTCEIGLAASVKHETKGEYNYTVYGDQCYEAEAFLLLSEREMISLFYNLFLNLCAELKSQTNTQLSLTPGHFTVSIKYFNKELTSIDGEVPHLQRPYYNYLLQIINSMIQTYSFDLQKE